MADFTFEIDEGGTLRKVPELPWRVGKPNNAITIQLVNHDTQNHRVRLERWKNRENNKSQDPLTGTKAWVALAMQSSRQTKHTVINHGVYNNGEAQFEFDIMLDGNRYEDPVIIVDEPPPFGPPPPPPPPPWPPKQPGKPKAKGAKSAAAKKAKRTTAAKKATKRTKTVRKAAKARKATKRVVKTAKTRAENMQKAKKAKKAKKAR
jgi:hypothetical protein